MVAVTNNNRTQKLNNDAYQSYNANSCNKTATTSTQKANPASYKPKDEFVDGNSKQDKFNAFMSSPSASATTLLTENANDSSVNCLDAADNYCESLPASKKDGANMVFMNDNRGGVEGKSGHVVVKENDGKVFDPASGKKYTNVDAYLSANKQYSVAGEVKAGDVKNILDTNPGSEERKKAIANAGVSSEIQNMMVADSTNKYTQIPGVGYIDGSGKVVDPSSTGTTSVDSPQYVNVEDVAKQLDGAKCEYGKKSIPGGPIVDDINHMTLTLKNGNYIKYDASKYPSEDIKGVAFNSNGEEIGQASASMGNSEFQVNIKDVAKYNGNADSQIVNNENTTPIVRKQAKYFDERPKETDIDTIVLHHTASNSDEHSLNTLQGNRGKEVSAHYMIGKDGTIYQLVDDQKRAWHAGEGSMKDPTTGKPDGKDLNDRSIGIEIVNEGDGEDTYTEAQYKALETLVPYLTKQYNIPTENIVGHKDVADQKKNPKKDPSENFEMQRIIDSAK